MAWGRKIMVLAFRNKALSGVLQLTVGIALIIAMLCASIIALGYYTRLSFLNHQIKMQLANRAVSGMQYMLARRTAMPLNEPLTIDVFGEGVDSVTVTRQPWGVFEVLTAEASQGDRKEVKTALVASQPDAVGKAAFYIPDNNAPVYLVGNTSIEGPVYASSRKFSTGHIDGKGYTRDKLVEGTVSKSDPMMPALDTTAVHAIRNIFSRTQGEYRLDPKSDVPADGSYSFSKRGVTYYFSNQSIDLSDSLAGNVIIHSSFKIRVTAAARLHDVILIAPDIDIDKGVKGSMQCFALRTIVVGSDSRLTYPSALVLIGGERDSTIVIQQDAQVQGVVIIPGHDQATGSRGVFKIAKKGIFHGAAYINGASDIQGQVWGHLMTRKTQVRIGSTVYGNHILDAAISASKRSRYMPAPLQWSNTKTTVIAKWLEYASQVY